MHSHSKMATEASARNAIQQYKRQSYEVDDKNPDHVAAYLLLRDTSRRISGKSLEDFLKSRKTTIGSGDRSTMDVWAVPRVNFPAGLPQHIANAERPVGTMSHQYSPDEFYFIDQVIPRTELGMSVITAGTFVQSSTTGTLPDAPAALPQASTPGAPSSSAPLPQPLAIDAGMPPPHGARATGGTDLPQKRRRPDHGVSDPPSPEPVGIKRARVQREVLTTLRDKFLDAVNNDLWVHITGSLAPHSVHSWLEKAVATFEELRDAEARRSAEDGSVQAPIQLMCAKYVMMVVKHFTRRPCYRHMPVFKGLLPRLVDVAGTQLDEASRDEVLLINNLASVDPDGDDVPSLDGIKNCLLVTTFHETALYGSFIDYRAQSVVAKAKAVGTTVDKATLLRPLQHTSGMNPALQSKIDVLCNLCSADATPESLATYIFYEPQAIELANEWFRDSYIGVIGRLVVETPQPLTGVPYDALAEAAVAITDANLDLKSQVAKELVNFVIDTVDQPQACIPLVQSALYHRVGIKDVAVQPVIKDIDAGVLAASHVYKKIKDFLPKGGKPLAWFVDWKAGIDKEVAEKKAVIDANAAADALKNQPPAAGAPPAGASAPATTSATGGGSSSDVFFVGQQLKIKSGKGKEQAGMVDVIQKSHCWIIISADDKSEPNKRKRIPKKCLVPNPAPTQTQVPDATAIDVVTGSDSSRSNDTSPPAPAAVPEPQAGASAEPPQVVPIDDAEVGEFRREAREARRGDANSKAKKDEAREQIAWDANLSVFDDVDE